MADLQPVPPPRSSFAGHGALIGTIVVISVLLAAVKPWGGTGGPPAATLFPTASLAQPAPSAQAGVPSLPSPTGFDLRYRPDLFGGPEPLPNWGLWPAGYMVTFGFAAPVPPEAPLESPPTSGADGSPDRSPDNSASSLPPGSGPPRTPAWPARFEVPEGSHLLVLGINTPLGYKVSRIELLRSDAVGPGVPVETELLPSPWPEHFTVIGIRSRAADGALEVWPAGRYRLDWHTEPGGINQSIEILIMPLPASSPAP